jgi:preprotein translocase subunit SecG
MGIFIGLMLSIVSVFLILLVLVQRGRGGGLAGALGGAGGQSAFGAKAGDVFTRITVVAAGVWIVLCAVAVKFMGSGATDALNIKGGGPTPKATAPLVPGDAKTPTDGKSSDKGDATTKTAAEAPAAKPPAEAPAAPAEAPAPPTEGQTDAPDQNK